MKKTSQTILALTLLFSGMLPFAWRSEVSFALSFRPSALRQAQGTASSGTEERAISLPLSFRPSTLRQAQGTASSGTEERAISPSLSFRPSTLRPFSRVKAPQAQGTASSGTEEQGISPLLSFGEERGISPALSFAHPACPLLPDSTACEAELLAMEVSGEMFPPAALYNQIYDDLTAIRQAYPKMNEIVHAPRWMPGELLVGFTEEAWQKVQNGSYHGFDELNREYGAVEMTTPYASIPYAYLRFEERHHPEPLASLYAQAEGVTSAEPNWAISDGTEIQVSHREYTFVLGWGDCPSGCMYHRYWHFTVNENGVTLTREFGDSLEQSTQLYFPIIQVP